MNTCPSNPSNAPTTRYGLALKSLLVGFFLSLYAVTIHTGNYNGDALDFSWNWALGIAYLQHLTWGKEFIFTYGPLGFLDYPTLFPNATLFLLASVVGFLIHFLSYCLYSYLLLSTLQKKTNALQAAFLMGWAILIALWTLASLAPDTVLMISALFLALLLTSQQASGYYSALILSTVLLSLSSMIKVSNIPGALLFLALFPLILCQSKTSFFNRALCSWAMGFASYSVLSLILWHSAQQPFSALPFYLHSLTAIISGYSTAMQLSGYRAQLCAALLIWLAFIYLWLAEFKKRSPLWRSLTLSIPILLGAWKEGFVRQDPSFTNSHAIYFFTVTLLISSVLWLLHTPQSRFLRICLIALITLSLIGSLNAIAKQLPLSQYGRILQQETTPSTYSALKANSDHMLRAVLPLSPPIQEALAQSTSLTVLPTNLIIAAAYHLPHLVFMPVIQGYSVYTPYLDKINANFLAQQGPQQVLFQKDVVIDHRYWLFDWPSTLQQLWRSYQPTVADSTNLVLTRRSHPLLLITHCGPMQNHPMNQWIPTSSSTNSNGWLKGKVGVHLNLIGKLDNLLYKAPLVYISLQLQNGETKGPYRFIWRNGQDGLYLSQFVDSIAGLQEALTSAPILPQNRIAAIKITTDGAFAYNSTVSMQLCQSTPRT